MSLDPPRGLHRDDYLHAGESAAQWLAKCDARMARKATQFKLHFIRTAANERRAERVPFLPGYTPATIVEELSSLDPEFDRHTDQYDRIMSWFGSGVCCPGYSYLPRGNCPEHGGVQ